MTYKEAIDKALKDNEGLRRLILNFARDNTEKYFVMSAMNKDESMRDKLYSYLTGVGQLYIYAVTGDAMKTIGAIENSSELSLAVRQLVIDPIMAEINDEAEKTIQRVVDEYDRSVKEHSA